MRFSLKPWDKLKVVPNLAARAALLDDVANTSERHFNKGMTGTKSGIKHRGLPRRSSAPGEYPANQSGRLKGSIYSKTRAKEAEVGSKTRYAGFLRNGTRFNGGRRSMSDTALIETVPVALARAKPHTRFANA